MIVIDSKASEKGFSVAQMLGISLFIAHILIATFVLGDKNYFPFKPINLVVTTGLAIAVMHSLLFWVIFSRGRPEKKRAFVILFLTAVGSSAAYAVIETNNLETFKRSVITFSEDALKDQSEQTDRRTSAKFSEVESFGRLAKIESFMNKYQYERLNIIARYAEKNAVAAYADLLNFEKYLSGEITFDQAANTLRKVLANIEEHKKQNYAHVDQKIKDVEVLDLDLDSDLMSGIRAGFKKSLENEREAVTNFWDLEEYSVQKMDLLIGALYTNLGAWKVGDDGLPEFEDPKTTTYFKNELIDLQQAKREFEDSARTAVIAWQQGIKNL